MISILLATFNGQRTLERTLAAFTCIAPPASPWRLVVVDNASTDRTPAILDGYRARLPLEICHEPRRGKSVALNRVLPLVGTGLAVFVDDDIVPEPGWLRALEATANADGGYDLFAGRIEPLWEASPPAWLLDAVPLDACYGVHRDMPEGPCAPHLLYGGNMAIRGAVIGDDFRFDEIYGPNGSPDAPMGGETAFVARIAARGAKAWHARGAVVRHIVPREHMRRDWLLARAGNFGRGQFSVGGDPVLEPYRLGARDPRGLARAMTACRWRAFLAGATGRSAARFRALWRLNYLDGFAGALEATRRRQAASAPMLGGELAQPRDAQ